MKRKINLVGQSTLTVSLPSKWAKENNLKKGDEVEVQEDNNKLSIFKGAFTKKKKEIQINADELGHFALAKLLIACYEESYDTIIITFSKKHVSDPMFSKNEDVLTAINRLVGRLVTFAVVSQTSNKIVISDFSEKLAHFDILISRIFFLIEEYLRLLMDDINHKNYDDLNARESRHDTITKYVALACRILMEDQERSQSNIVHNYLILNYLDKVTDFIRYAYRNTQDLKNRINEQSIILMKKTLEYIDLFRSLYNKFDYAVINKLDILRADINGIKKKISISKPNELTVVTNLSSLVEILNGAVKSRIALNLN